MNLADAETLEAFYAAQTSTRTQFVQLDVYDLRGQRVRTLARGDYAPGTHLLTWDGRDDAGVSVPSGTYVARLAGGDQLRTHKMVLAK